MNGMVDNMIDFANATTMQLIKLHFEIGLKILTRLWWVWVLLLLLFYVGWNVLRWMDVMKKGKRNGVDS